MEGLFSEAELQRLHEDDQKIETEFQLGGYAVQKRKKVRRLQAGEEPERADTKEDWRHFEEYLNETDLEDNTENIDGDSDLNIVVDDEREDE